MNLCTLFASALADTPDKTALICGDDSCTFAELERHTTRYARAFAHLGLEQGDRLGLFMYNRLEIIYCYFACFRLGIIAVPSSIFSKRAEILYEAEKCGTKAYIVDGKLFSHIKGLDEQLPDLNHIVSLDDNDLVDPDQLFATFLDDSTKNIEPVDVDPAHPAVILYTSGSTGRPKGVTHTHGSLAANAEFRTATLHHNGAHAFVTTSFLCHGGAITIVLLPMLYGGGTALFLLKEQPKYIFDMLQKHVITHMAGTPSLWQHIHDSPLCSKKYFNNIQYATCGGSGVSLALLQALDKKCSLQLTIGLGMTECGGYMITPPDLVYKQGALGKPLHGVEVRLVDDRYNDVENGSVGQILVCGKNVFSGYWLDPENTRDAFHDGWFLTGDLAYCDSDGYYHFSGRCKNIIIRDSGNITPEEVEYVLTTHDQVQEALVVGVPDADYGQSVFAFIQPAHSDQVPTVEELTAYVRSKIAERKIPQYYYFSASLQGEGIMGKINRKKLAKKAMKLVAEGEAQGVE